MREFWDNCAVPLKLQHANSCNSSTMHKKRTDLSPEQAHDLQIIEACAQPTNFISKIFWTFSNDTTVILDMKYPLCPISYPFHIMWLQHFPWCSFFESGNSLKKRHMCQCKHTGTHPRRREYVDIHRYMYIVGIERASRRFLNSDIISTSSSARRACFQ